MSSIEYIKPFERAWDKMLELLFRPFRWGIWFKLGLLAWLAFLFEGPLSGGGSTIPNPSDFKNAGGHGGHAWAPSSSEIWLIAGVVAIILVVLALVGLLALWIKSHGKFMFLDALAKGPDALPFFERWNKTSKLGNSLFLLLLSWTLLALLLCLPPLAGAAYFGFKLFQKIWSPSSTLDSLFMGAIRTGQTELFGILSLLLLVFAISCASHILLRIIIDFGSLRMYKTGCSAFSAAGKALSLAAAKPWATIKYLLCLLCVNIATQLAALAVVAATCLLCCIGCIVLSLPYLWAVAMLPALSFRQLFTIEFCAQLGDEWNLKELSAKLPEEGKAA
jgi:hypothetical protein